MAGDLATALSERSLLEAVLRTPAALSRHHPTVVLLSSLTLAQRVALISNLGGQIIYFPRRGVPAPVAVHTGISAVPEEITGCGIYIPLFEMEIRAERRRRVIHVHARGAAHREIAKALRCSTRTVARILSSRP